MSNIVVVVEQYLL